MKITEIISEGLSSQLYHYRSNIATVARILNTGVFQLTSSHGSKIDEPLAPKNNPYYLSLTRTKLGHYHSNPNSGGTMFNMDGEWYSRHYKGNAVDHFSGMGKKDFEAEDRLFSKEPTISIDGVTEISIYIDTTKEFDKGILRSIIINAKKRNIPLFIYNDKQSWILQDHRKVIPISDFGNMTGNVYQRGQETHQPSNNLIAVLELIHKKSLNELSNHAKKLIYDISNDPSYQIKYVIGYDMRHARKPGGNGRKHLINIIKLMNTNNWTITTMVNWISNKWKKIEQQNKKPYDPAEMYAKALQKGIYEWDDIPTEYVQTVKNILAQK